MDLNKEILKTIKYFSFFAYYPTLSEIHTFLQAEISKNELKKELEGMVKQKSIINCQSLIDNSQRYTVGEYSKKVSNNKYQISKRKLNNILFRAYIKLLSLFPQIKLIGLSGSISMMNAGEEDDIDLFIITAKNRLFTGRLIALLLAQIIGLRRSRKARSLNFLAPVGTFPAPSAGVSQVAKNFNSSLSFNNETMKQLNNRVYNKVCLNLFFDESNLKVPKFKQTEFVGHEVLQMKPIISKDSVYDRFLQANKWVFRLFPNAGLVFSMKKILNTEYSIPDTLNGWLEDKLKKFQLHFIDKHKTSEIITSSQLWFHPVDFGEKIKS